MSNKDRFWHIRSAKYDKLFWTKDDSYINAIIKTGDFKDHELVLDVGTGTGIMARTIRPHVKHVVGLDFSESMLEKGKWEGISMVKWDINDSLFHNNIFDKIVARMMFHHIMDNLDRAILRCFDLLKQNGKLIIAEGVPPSDEKDVIDWYARMFRYKEIRRTFTSRELEQYLRKNGFKNVKTKLHVMKNFNINNWLDNSGLDGRKKRIILGLHQKADKKIKDLYNMRQVDGQCIVDTKNVIVVGEK